MLSGCARSASRPSRYYYIELVSLVYFTSSRRRLATQQRAIFISYNFYIPSRLPTALLYEFSHAVTGTAPSGFMDNSTTRLPRARTDGIFRRPINLMTSLLFSASAFASWHVVERCLRGLPGFGSRARHEASFCFESGGAPGAQEFLP